MEPAPDRSGPVIDRLERALSDHVGAVRRVVLAVFILIHIARLDRLLVSGDGQNYLAGALRIADGDLPFPRYSPGLSVILAPLAALSDGHPQILLNVAGGLNLLLAVSSLVLLHRFLRAYLSPATSVSLVAAFALGATATTVLVGTEVEPISLLLVAGTLVALQDDRPWVAVAATAAAGMTRVALVPWFGVLWLLRVRRSPRPAIAALGLLGADVATYLLLSRRGGYLGIADQSYTQGHDRSAVAGLLEIVPDHLVRYVRLGVPSSLWPNYLLATPPGYLLGAATTLCVVVGGWAILRGTTGTVAVDGVARPAVLGAVVYAVALWFWPANDGAVLRLSTPLAPVVLLALVVGAGRIAHRLWPDRWRELVAAGLAVALMLGLVSSIGLTVRQRTSEPPVRDFVATARRGLDEVPSGPMLSNAPAFTQIVTGRRVIAFSSDATAKEVRSLAEANRACAVVATSIQGDGPEGLDVTLLDDGRARRVATSSETQIIALDESWCE